MNSVDIKNFSIVRGDTNIISFSLFDNNGNPFVLSSQDMLYFTVKTDSVTSSYVFQKTTGNGITYNADTKEYEIEIDSESTNNLPYRTFVYDIELVAVLECVA